MIKTHRVVSRTYIIIRIIHVHVRMRNWLAVGRLLFTLPNVIMYSQLSSTVIIYLCVRRAVVVAVCDNIFIIIFIFKLTSGRSGQRWRPVAFERMYSTRRLGEFSFFFVLRCPNQASIDYNIYYTRVRSLILILV